jgi:hypothetical protein
MRERGLGNESFFSINNCQIIYRIPYMRKHLIDKRNIIIHNETFEKIYLAEAQSRNPFAKEKIKGFYGLK